LRQQWFFNQYPVAAVTGSVLRIAEARLAHSGDYSVVVQDTSGASTSIIARLTIVPGPQPRLLDYPSQTAVNNVPFVGARPHVFTSVAPTSWRLLEAPAGMTLDSGTAIPQWTTPSVGRHYINMWASNSYGIDSVDWILNVISNDVPNTRVVSPRYTDWVVPAWFAQWMEQWEAHKVIDLEPMICLSL
jgi:hypothetical protein